MAEPEQFPREVSASPLRLLRVGQSDAEAERGHDPTEDELRHAFAADPRQAMNALFDQYYRVVCNHVVRFVYARELAEDITSEVFISFWHHRLYQSVQQSYRAYLFTAARNRALNHLRNETREERRRGTRTDLASVEQSPSLHDFVLSPERIVEYQEMVFGLEAAVEGLSPQCKKVFLMSRFDGLKNATIAEQLGISLKAVEAHITKGLHRLRQALGEQGLLLLCCSLFSSLM
jgi:RNA polymerase sigma-70 factor (ECF subfamily)